MLVVWISSESVTLVCLVFSERSVSRLRTRQDCKCAFSGSSLLHYLPFTSGVINKTVCTILSPTFSISAPFFPTLILRFNVLCKLGLESCSFENALRSPVLTPCHVSSLSGEPLHKCPLLCPTQSESSQMGTWKLDSAAADGSLKANKETVPQPHTHRAEGEIWLLWVPPRYIDLLTSDTGPWNKGKEARFKLGVYLYQDEMPVLCVCRPLIR